MLSIVPKEAELSRVMIIQVWGLFQEIFFSFIELERQIYWNFYLHFSFQYHPWITYLGQEYEENDHWLKNLLIDKQILHVNTLGNV